MQLSYSTVKCEFYRSVRYVFYLIKFVFDNQQKKCTRINDYIMRVVYMVYLNNKGSVVKLFLFIVYFFRMFV